MKAIRTPQASCRAGFASGDITPPVGIYHRMWGAALHDRATGIHRPLEAKLMWMEPLEDDSGKEKVDAVRILVSLVVVDSVTLRLRPTTVSAVLMLPPLLLLMQVGSVLLIRRLLLLPTVVDGVHSMLPRQPLCLLHRNQSPTFPS